MKERIGDHPILAQAVAITLLESQLPTRHDTVEIDGNVGTMVTPFRSIRHQGRSAGNSCDRAVGEFRRPACARRRHPPGGVIGNGLLRNRADQVRQGLQGVGNSHLQHRARGTWDSEQIADGRDSPARHCKDDRQWSIVDLSD